MKMKVLIVDDEFLLCEHIRRTIDWDNLGMEVIGSAYDGERALQIIADQAPQIVLTDISMPTMDGLELSKQIHKKYPEIAVIIISGYGEFQYAQTAIRYGVKQYLLKPVDKEIYTEALHTTKNDLLSVQMGTDKERIKKENNRRKIWNVMQSYIHADINESEFEQQILTSGGKLPDGPKVLLLFKYRLDHIDLDSGVPEMENIILGQFDRLLPSNNNAPLFTWHNGKGILICSASWAERDDILAQLEVLCVQLEQERTINMFIGVSEIFTELNQIPHCYGQAERALNSRFVFADWKVIACETISKDETFSLSRYLNVDQMLIDLRNNNRDALFSGENGVNMIFQRLREDVASKENAVFTATMCASAINEFLSETSLSLVGINPRELIREAMSKDTLQELCDFVCMLVDKALSDVFVESHPRLSQRVEDAKQYIMDHLSDTNLSLHTVADQLYMNKSYLSDLFKRETGMNMIDFISRSRLALVKQELDNDPHQKLVMIAKKAGFNSEYYLIRCFKKMYGITPGNYGKLKHIASNKQKT